MAGRPKLYSRKRWKTMLDGDLGDRLRKVAEATDLPATYLLDDAVADWLETKSHAFLGSANPRCLLRSPHGIHREVGSDR